MLFALKQNKGFDGVFGTHSLEQMIGSERSKTNGYHSAFAKRKDITKWVTNTRIILMNFKL